MKMKYRVLKKKSVVLSMELRFSGLLSLLDSSYAPTPIISTSINTHTSYNPLPPFPCPPLVHI